MRTKQLMNRDWRYYFGEPSFMREDKNSSDQTYRGSRAANGRGPARRDFDDAGWQIVSLPHDFVALNGISETDPRGGEHSDFPMDRGSAWYRRYFKMAEADKDKRVVLYFEGMGTLCEVYVNSMLQYVSRTNGIGFAIDITDTLRYGDEENVVAVHCDCHDYEAWYYEGGGITRNVWMIVTDRLAVDHWGTFVRSERLSDTKWKLTIDTKVVNRHREDKNACIVSRIVPQDGLDAGKEAACVDSPCQAVASYGEATFKQTLEIENPNLWSPKEPHLYTLVSEVVCDGEVVDKEETTFGIRELKYDADHGLYVNGEKTVIYGFANHMIYLGVGEAMTDSMCEFQIRTLREMGSNGYRTAHSPHQDAIMDWCDRYGQLVMDENRIFHSSEFGIDEVRRLILRDRNHPSVCMWAMYNEEDFVTNETGIRIFKTLKEEVRKLDPTRPVTGATSYGMFSEGMHDDYDIFGFNHQSMHFDSLHKVHAGKPIFCSEMIFPVGKARRGGMGVRPAEDAHQLQKEFPIGGFHFTGWAEMPSRPRIIGMEGTYAAGYYGFRALLRPDEPIAKIFPAWDFPGQEGKKVELSLANNGDTVEVYRNGEKILTAETDLYQITPVEIEYQPGELKIVAYKNGEKWAEDVSVTPGAPFGLELVCENKMLKADGTDTALVSAYVVDKDGNRCLTDRGRLLHFSWNEAGELVSTNALNDNGFQGYMGPDVRNFLGKAQAILRTLPCQGPMVVRVESEGLQPAEIEIPWIMPDVEQVPACKPGYVLNWKISKLIPGEMDDEKVIREHNVQRWQVVDTMGSPAILAGARSNPFGGKPGLYPDDVALNYAYYNHVVVPEDLKPQTEDAVLALHFEGIDGKANLYVTDGKKCNTGHHASDSPWFGHYRPEWVVPCPDFKPGDEVDIWVMMHDLGRVHGIGWPVYWEYTTMARIKALEDQTAKEWDFCNHDDDK